MNIAARLESFAKEEKGPKQLGVACRVLIGDPHTNPCLLIFQLNGLGKYN